MKKNIIKSLLSLILSVSMLLTGLGLTVHADPGTVPEVLTDAYLKFVPIGGTDPYGWGAAPSLIEVKDAEEVIISPVGDNQYENVPNGSSVFLQYSFYLEDGMEDEDQYIYTDLHTFSIELPIGLDFTDETGESNISLQGTAGTFSWQISGDKINVTLTDISGASMRRGVIELTGKVESDGIGENNSIEFAIGGSTVVIGREEESPEVDELNLTKNGEYDHNANEITWTVTATLNESDDLYGYTLVDDYSSRGNHDYVAESFKIVDENGNETSVLDSELEIDKDNRVIKYVFPEESVSPVKIQYKTKPNSYAGESPGQDGDTKSTYTNKAYLEQDDVKVTPDMIRSVTKDWLDKQGHQVEGTDDVPYIMKWVVTLNVPKDETLSNVKLIDTIGNGHELYTDGTHKVSIITGGQESAQLSEGDTGQNTYSLDGQTLTMRLTDVSGDTTITYYTKVSDPDDSLNTNSPVSFKNSVIFEWEGLGEAGKPSAGGAVGIVGGGGLLHKESDGGLDDFNPNLKYIKWTIRVNGNNVYSPGAVVEDTIGAGQQLVIDSEHLFLVGTTEGGSEHETVSEMADTANLDITDNGFKYTLGNINSTYYITYYTEVTDFSSLYVNDDVTFGNNVELSRTEMVTVPVDGEKTFSSQMLDKSIMTSYNYVTRKVTWQIDVNRNELDLTNASVIDILPTGMVGVSSTDTSGDKIDVTIKNLSDNNVVYDDPFTVDIVNGEFEVELPPNVDGERETSDYYRLTFTTYLIDEALYAQGPKTFKNWAELKADEIKTEIKDSAQFSITNPVISKAGKHTSGNDFVVWEVQLNGNQVDLPVNTYVWDVLNSNLELDESSVKLYKVAVDSGTGVLGSIENGQEVTLNPGDLSYEKYTGEGAEEGQHLFELKLPTGPYAYRLIFNTFVLSSGGTVNVTNTISLRGAGGDTESGSEVSSVSVSNLWSYGEGGINQFTIFKKDVNGEVGLPGAEFKLVNRFGTAVTKGGQEQIKVTDADGNASFTGLPAWHFGVEEIKPPVGYLLPSERSDRITDIGRPPYENEGVIPVANKKAFGNLQLKKIDELDRNPIEGVIFTIEGTPDENIVYDTDDFFTPQEYYTDSEGVLNIDNLPLGSYTLTETTPKPGYLEPTRSIEFIVDYNDDFTEAIIKIINSNPEGIEINEDGQIVFENTYEPEPASLMIPVQKRIIGHPTPSNKTFTFILTAIGGSPMPEGVEGDDSPTNEVEIVGTGSTSFAEIIFNEEDTYQYTIEETEGSEPGYGYDKAIRTITVVVTDNRDEGRLEAKWTVEGEEEVEAVTFTNVYAPGSATIAFPIEKLIETEYEISENKLFKFELAADGYAPMPEGAVDGKITATITGEGKSAFPLIVFGSAGTYKYKVSEVKGNDDGYTYSSVVYDVTVSVWDTGGSLAASWQVQGLDAGTAVDVLSFTNSYKPEGVDLQLPVTKIIEGGKPQADALFSFSIKALETGTPLPTSLTTTVEGAGDAAFGNIRYTEPGVYKYRVSEEDGKQSGYTYDQTIYDLTVTVKDVDGKLVVSYIVEENGKAVDKIVFTNNFSDEDIESVFPTEPGDESKPGGLPQTGEGRSTSLPGLALIVAGLALGLFSLQKRRPRKRTSGQ